MPLDSTQKLEYLYKEYARLSNAVEERVKSLYDDFKLLGALSASVLVWKPISDLLSTSNANFNSDLALFLGFLGIEAVIGIIGAYTLTKHSDAWYLAHTLQSYEVTINQLIEGSEDSNFFAFYSGMNQLKYITATYKTAYLLLSCSIRCPAIVFPFIMLCFTNLVYALIFLGYAAVNVVAHIVAYKTVFKQYTSEKMFHFF